MFPPRTTMTSYSGCKGCKPPPYSFLKLVQCGPEAWKAEGYLSNGSRYRHGIPQTKGVEVVQELGRGRDADHHAVEVDFGEVGCFCNVRDGHRGHVLLHSVPRMDSKTGLCTTNQPLVHAIQHFLAACLFERVPLTLAASAHHKAAEPAVPLAITASEGGNTHCRSPTCIVDLRNSSSTHAVIRAGDSSASMSDNTDAKAEESKGSGKPPSPVRVPTPPRSTSLRHEQITTDLPPPAAGEISKLNSTDAKLTGNAGVTGLPLGSSKLAEGAKSEDSLSSVAALRRKMEQPAVRSGALSPGRKRFESGAPDSPAHKSQSGLVGEKVDGVLQAAAAKADVKSSAPSTAAKEMKAVALANAPVIAHHIPAPGKPVDVQPVPEPKKDASVAAEDKGKGVPAKSVKDLIRENNSVKAVAPIQSPKLGHPAPVAQANIAGKMVDTRPPFQPALAQAAPVQAPSTQAHAAPVPGGAKNAAFMAALNQRLNTKPPSSKTQTDQHRPDAAGPEKPEKPSSTKTQTDHDRPDAGPEKAEKTAAAPTHTPSDPPLPHRLFQDGPTDLPLHLRPLRPVCWPSPRVLTTASLMPVVHGPRLPRAA